MARIKPRGPRRRGASWPRFVFVLPLKDDLGHELHVEGFTRADAGSAVEVADRVTHEAKSLAGIARRTDYLSAAVRVH